MCLLSFKYFATLKKRLRTAYCLLRGSFSFESSLLRLTNKQIFTFFCNSHKTPSHLELNLKPRLIEEDLRFENGEYHSGDEYPPSILAGNVRTRDAFRPVALEQEYLIDHNFGYSPVLARVYLVFDAFRSITREQKYLMGNNAE